MTPENCQQLNCCMEVIHVNHLVSQDDNKDIMMNEKLESLLEMLEDVNPETARPGKTSKDVIEI